MPASRAARHLVLFSLLCFALGLGAPLALAQENSDAEEMADDNPYGSGMGFEVLLTNNGFGLGGYYNREVAATTSITLDFSLGAGKDDRELKFFSRFGSGFVPNKRNYLLILPVQLGVQQRLFATSIEDNFRPYLHVSAGPTLGWVYPYFQDINGDERYDEDIERRYDVFTAFPKGEMRFGLGGTIALGAYFGWSRRLTQGVRFGYTLNYFFQEIALLEPDVKAPQHLFNTPVISITFGKLF